ncbi:uncharacterized protein PHACADRAFT_205155 [Phanerochaete carnosa HHB-10118-sp]|uniref:Uncharacterized protein n=1 Tax=Phanerochaete carnosa (strain HHB-10118-sp) TaxID=650164 RepID=K5WHY5_PHACS|nr:uncharacterized protein PHACADRAFT_205155 [Phanerochaete carnosa HHB-10118-sp]EKM58965.1 hypothetical protein PHACADRAFT_205155 [Phanerochaete carnosa HHB-10118-sp]
MFAALETLDMEWIMYNQALVPLLHSTSSIQFHSLFVLLEPCIEDEDIEAVHQAVDAPAKLSSLRSLTLIGDSAIGPTFPPEPFLKLHSLEELYLNIPGFFLTSQDVESTLHSWSLDALECFATHLPMLEQLTTENDTSTVPTLGVPLARSLIPISLIVASSPLREEHWWHAATYISHVYPNASCTLSYSDVDSKGKDEDERLNSNQLCWRYVNRAIAAARTNQGVESG